MHPKLAMRAAFVSLVFAAGGATAAEPAQIYKMLPDTSLSGVMDPAMPDRSGIKKAWPKPPADPKRIKVGWSEITMSGPWFVELRKGVERDAKKYGFDVDMQVADGDLQRQCSHIETFVTKKVDIIVVDPTDTLGVSNCINRAVDAGIPVVAVGTVPEASARILTTVTPNPYENGYGAGRYIAKQAGKDAPITAALIIGIVGNSTAESRLNGTIGGIVHERMQQLGIAGSREDAMLRGYKLFQSAKKTGKFDDPELKFASVALAEGKWTEEGGLAAAEDILSAHANRINYVITDNDHMALGAMRAVRGVGKQKEIKVATSADGFRVALDQIKKGNLLVTGTFSGEQTGVAVVEFLNQIYNQGLDANNLPLGSYFPAATITPDNVDQYIDPDKGNKFYKYTITPVKTIPQLREELAAKR